LNNNPPKLQQGSRTAALPPHTTILEHKSSILIENFSVASENFNQSTQPQSNRMMPFGDIGSTQAGNEQVSDEELEEGEVRPSSPLVHASILTPSAQEQHEDVKMSHQSTHLPKQVVQP